MVFPSYSKQELTLEVKLIRLKLIRQQIRFTENSMKRTSILSPYVTSS
uniref:Uncharacterized protein n=1 Tax=Arundo donax TaxID=35708 RepID=A0A0A9EYK5_ARUDO